MTVQLARRNPGRVSQPLPGRGTWWVQPVAVSVGFTLFVLYAFWSVAFSSGAHAWVRGPYLSPFYSPLIKLPIWPLSSAFLVAWVPLAFRGTCYYYRKAYYRAFFWDPPACAVAEPRRHEGYVGERGFPWVLNNFHRFFLYLALIVLGWLWWDTISAFRYDHGFYLGVGSVLMLANVVLLTGYTFSCHALRHFVGGSVNCFSCVRGGRARHGMLGLVSRLNPYHGSFAWFSLVSVCVVDVYIRVVSSGVFGSCFGTHLGC